MEKVVECVPNFSEGRDKEIISKITGEIEKVDGVYLLDVDMGSATNRTVVTFVGSPEGVFEAAFNAIKKASELIDMKKHHGEHPRIGACDVCPFVPVSNVTMEECVGIARRLGKKVGEEIGIPVYLYEEAASASYRKNLADIREGEYEGLQNKIKDIRWKPDFGPSQFNPKSGATIIGAREFLIAYNINLNTKEKKLANLIATHLREKGGSLRDKDGNIVKDESGNSVIVPGVFKNVKAVGWFIEEYNIAQVSINLTNYKISPPHIVLEEARRKANEIGVVVTGSEIVGLVPLDAMIMAGKYYLQRQNASRGVPQEDIIDIAIRSMGLNELYPFEPQKKIIEYRIRKDDKKSLVKMSIRDFVNEVSRQSPAPGGGSVAALCGSLSSALSSMVANLTVGKKEYKEAWEEMNNIAEEAQKIKDVLLQAIDDDASAFNKVMDAIRLPKKSEEEIKKRESEIEKVTIKATEVPLSVMENSLKALKLAMVVAEKGNKNSLTDAGVSSLMAHSAIISAYYNVLINLSSIKDEEYRKKTIEKAKKIIEEGEGISEKIKKIITLQLLE